MNAVWACLRVDAHRRWRAWLAVALLVGLFGGAVTTVAADARRTGSAYSRLRPMCGLKQHRSARTLAAGHALVQNLRRGHYDIATDVPDHHRLRIAFDDLATTI